MDEKLKSGLDALILAISAAAIVISVTALYMR